MNNYNNKPNPAMIKSMAAEMNIKELFYIIKKRLWIVAVIAILFSALGTIYSTYFTNFMYQTSSRIIINADAEYRKTLQVIMKDPTIMEKVVQDLNLDRTPEDLSGQISVQSIDSSQVVSIGVTDKDPQMAADIANTTALVFKEEIPNIVGFNSVQLLSDAKSPYVPINDNSSRNIIISLFIGIVAGIGFVFLLHSLDDSVKSKEDIEEFIGVPVLGKVSKMKSRKLMVKNGVKQEVDTRGETIGS